MHTAFHLKYLPSPLLYAYKANAKRLSATVSTHTAFPNVILCDFTYLTGLVIYYRYKSIVAKITHYIYHTAKHHNPALLGISLNMHHTEKLLSKYCRP
jgi:hypothetical protein